MSLLSTRELPLGATASSAADVSVVVCAYDHDRWQDLKAAVESVCSQSVPAREVIVVIDHNPRLLDLARANLAGVRVLENAGGRGAGEARNTGVSVASGSIVAFLDDDARASRAWIENAIEAFADPTVMGVGGTIEPAWDERAPAWFPEEFNWVVGCTYPGLPELPAPVRNLISANMFVRRSMFDDLGGFRVGFGKQDTRSRPEETDLCLRANQHFPRHVWLYHPRVVVQHRVPPSRGHARYFTSRCYNEGAGKAALVDFVGGEGVAAERVYTRRTLPKGFAGGIKSALRGDPSGIARSSAIVFGLSVTVAGYAVEKLRLRLRRRGSAPKAVPVSPEPARELSESLSGRLDVQAPVAVRAIDLEFGPGTPRLPPSPSGKPYQRLAVLLRRAGWPLGWATVRVSPDGEVSAEELAMLAAAAPPDAPAASEHAVARAGHTAGQLLTVVIATCADDESVVRCVEAIRSSAADPFEVIVVENRPAHSTVEQTLAERFPGDRRIRCIAEARPGLAPARNAGLAAARGEIVAFTDDDVVVDSAWIAAIRCAFDAQPNAACVTGLILPLELETAAQLLVEQFASFGKGFAARVYSLDDPPVDQPLFPYTAGYFGSGANMAFRTDVIRRLGGFDPLLGTGTSARGGEDLDICIRLLHAGHTLSYDPRSIVWHRHPDSAEGLRRRAFDYGVGLGAMLSKQLLIGPNRWRMLSLAPRGLRYFIDPRSRKNALRSPIFPRKLSLLEQAGLLYGPVAYLTSRVRGSR